MGPPVVLVHGGLPHEGMNAQQFWLDTGVVAALVVAGADVAAPDRMPDPADWRDEAAHLAAFLETGATVIAGSNGCSAALRLALDHPELVGRLALCWPATAETGIVRGVTDDELGRLAVPTLIVPSHPENPGHRRVTVEQLATLIPRAELTRGCREPLDPSFDCAEFIDQVVPWMS